MNLTNSLSIYILIPFCSGTEWDFSPSLSEHVLGPLDLSWCVEGDGDFGAVGDCNLV